MPRILITHDVQDVERWLQGKAERIAALQGGSNVTDLVAADGSNRAAVVSEVDDLDAFNALMASPPPEMAAQAESHGVVMPHRHPVCRSVTAGHTHRANEYKADPAELSETGSGVERVTRTRSPAGRDIGGLLAGFMARAGQAAYVASRNSVETDLPDGSVDTDHPPSACGTRQVRSSKGTPNKGNRR